MRKPFYGWVIVGVALLTNFMTTGTHFYVFNAFMEPLVQTRGWTRAGINLGFSIGGVVGLAGQYVHGTVVMRMGPRVYMGVGAVLSGIVFAAMGRIHSMAAFYVLYLLLFFFNGMFCGIVANTAVNNWFVRKKGRALGMSQVGISLSGVAIPFLGLWLIRRVGLDNAFLVLGCMLACLSPICLALIRDTPEKMGLLPDGEPPPKPHDAREGREGDFADEPVWSIRDAARTGAFWKTGIVYAMAMMGVVGVMSQLMPRFSDVGFSPDTAMRLMALTALLGAMAKYIWGLLCDRFDPRRVVGIMLLMCGAGLLCGLFARGMVLSLFFVVLYGFSMGGVLATTPIMVAELFGRVSFTAISRFMAFFLVFQNLGFVIMGASYYFFTSYDAAFGAFVVLYAAAAVLIFSVKRPAPAP